MDQPNRLVSSNSLHQLAAKILSLIHYLSPVLIIIFFLTTFVVRSVYVSTASNDHLLPVKKIYGPGGKPLPQRRLTGIKRKKDQQNDFAPARRLIFQALAALSCATFLGSAVVVLMHFFADPSYWCGEAFVIYTIGGFFVYSVLMLSVIDAKPSPTTVQLSTWCLCLVSDSLRLSLYLSVHRNSSPRRLLNGWNVLEACINISRIVLLSGSIFLYLLYSRVIAIKQSHVDSERAPLLSSTATTATTTTSATSTTTPTTTRRSNNGQVVNGSSATAMDEDDRKPGYARPNQVPSRSWFEYLRGYAIFFPYLWPAGNRKLQVRVFICLVLVLVQRCVNLLVPYQIGVVTDILSREEGSRIVPWAGIVIYILYRLLQGSSSLIGVTQSTLWIPVSQYSYRELTVASFEHVHSLSLDFHLAKKTAEVTSALNKGKAINDFLNQVTFQVLPMLVDLAVAVGYFLIVFDAYYALAVAIVTFWYIYFTIRLAKWRTEAKRTATNAEREVEAIMGDSMLCYEIVKYFNAEAYEFDRYRGAVSKFQSAEYTSEVAMQLMNFSQNLIFMGGVMIVCFIGAYQVTQGQITVGKFTALLAYLAQLQAPLNFFGTFYRTIQASMIKSERMLELFKEQPSVVNQPHVKDLPSCKGDIRFKNVKFAYDRRQDALKGLDFHCKPGTATALVGESGGGKSTVFNLLFRFYNACSGSIQIDGQDVQDLTFDSVRRHIGVVPQDSILFNATIMFNLKYAKPDATDEEVYRACRAASIHDKILSFSDGYNTQVGERGQLLSGGERQRVTIARTLLKAPSIIMLDEATSSLDTKTEHFIRNALELLGEGRTMLVIAHRLSTITGADQILVLHQGQVVERGTHQELIARKGRYESMWNMQAEAHKADTQSVELRRKANRLRRESKGQGSLPAMKRVTGICIDDDDDDEEQEECLRRRLIFRMQVEARQEQHHHHHHHERKSDEDNEHHHH